MNNYYKKKNMMQRVKDILGTNKLMNGKEIVTNGYKIYLAKVETVIATFIHT